MDSGTIGEYYALCELWRNGYNAVKSENPRETGWDVLVMSAGYNAIIAKLQVKTINWTSFNQSKVITGDYRGDFDFLIVVILNYEMENYTVFVIPKNKIIPRPKNQKHGLLDAQNNFLYTNKTITFTRVKDFREQLSKYKDNWSQINNGF